MAESDQRLIELPDDILVRVDTATFPLWGPLPVAPQEFGLRFLEPLFFFDFELEGSRRFASSQLKQDFRKVGQEFRVLSAFLADVARLGDVLTQPTEVAESLRSVFLEPDAEELSVRHKVIAHLFKGKSLYQFAVAAGLHTPDVRFFLEPAYRLQFDVQALAVENPLFARLKAYLRFDGQLNPSHILATAALIIQLTAYVYPPTPPLPTPPSPTTGPPPPPPITIGVTKDARKAALESDACAYSEKTRDLYEEDLRLGGQLALQTYLKVLGYYRGNASVPNRAETKRAMDQFCARNNIVCTSPKSKVLRQSVAVAMARSFPVCSAAGVP